MSLTAVVTNVIADTLIDSSGHILIPGINEAVAELTEEERKRYEAIEFDVENFKNKIGTDGLMYDTKVNLQYFNNSKFVL